MSSFRASSCARSTSIRVTNKDFDVIGVGAQAQVQGQGTGPTTGAGAGRGQSTQTSQTGRGTSSTSPAGGRGVTPIAERIHEPAGGVPERLHQSARPAPSAAASWACTARARKHRSASTKGRPATTSGTSWSPPSIVPAEASGATMPGGQGGAQLPGARGGRGNTNPGPNVPGGRGGSRQRNELPRPRRRPHPQVSRVGRAAPAPTRTSDRLAVTFNWTKALLRSAALRPPSASSIIESFDRRLRPPRRAPAAGRVESHRSRASGARGWSAGQRRGRAPSRSRATCR